MSKHKVALQFRKAALLRGDDASRPSYKENLHIEIFHSRHPAHSHDSSQLAFTQAPAIIIRTLEGYPNDHLSRLTLETKSLQYDSCSTVAIQPAIQTGHSKFRTRSLSVSASRAAIVLDTPCRISDTSGCGPEMMTCKYTRAALPNIRVMSRMRDSDASEDTVVVVTSVGVVPFGCPELVIRPVSSRISISAARRTSSHILKPPLASKRLFHSLSVAISRMRRISQFSQPMSLSTWI